MATKLVQMGTSDITKKADFDSTPGTVSAADKIHTILTACRTEEEFFLQKAQSGGPTGSNAAIDASLVWIG